MTTSTFHIIAILILFSFAESAFTTKAPHPFHRRSPLSSSSPSSSSSVEDVVSLDLLSKTEVEAPSTNPFNEQDPTKKQRRRTSILVCPAQFCVPDDYQDFFSCLSSLSASDPSLPEIGTCRVAPLPRTEWIKVAKQLPTSAFLRGELNVTVTLDWYFQAMEKAITEILAEEGEQANICIIGHSIGGWVARAFLGGLSLSSTALHKIAQERCTSLITLGTPHVSPETALVDQTRGLLRAIDQSPECKAEALAKRGIDVTCVCSSSLSGNFWTANVEELVAASSYLPLLGRLDETVKGDGIVPLELAFLEEPARHLIIEECPATNKSVRHSHVIPTPWNLWDGYASSIRLPDDLPSYVSEGVVPLWAKYIQ